MPHFEKSALFVGAAAFVLAALALFFLRGQPEAVMEVAPPKRSSLSSSAKIPHLPSVAVSALPATKLAPERPVVTSFVAVSEKPVTEEQKFAQLDNLQEAAITYSPAAIPLIEPSLYSSDREIREAAADAMVALGETAGAAVLRKAAAKARDPREAAALLERAEYLELPPGRLLLREKKSTTGGAPPSPRLRAPSR